MNISDITKNTGRFLDKNSPAIFMGLSIAGVITTAYLTHKAAQKSAKTLSEVAGLTPKEKLQLTWKPYVPALLSCGMTVGFIIAGNTVHARRQAALFTAVSLGETALSEYKEKMVETLGKNKEQKAADELVQEKVTQKEKEGAFKLTDLKPDSQDQFVFDIASGRVFTSTVEKLNKAANEVARWCLNNDYASLNFFYSKIGLSDIPIGNILGWNNDHPIELDLGTAVVHENRGVLAVRFVHDPFVDFDNLR